MNKVELKVKRLTESAILPTRGSEHAGGFDLYADEKVALNGGKYALVKTGIAVSIPEDKVGLIWPRSGHAIKHGVSARSGCDTGAGVIDADYRGEVKVLLFNFGKTNLFFNTGDRIAQLVITDRFVGDIVEVDDLDFTERGENGFGSTGK